MARNIKAMTCTRWVEVWLAEPKAHLSSGAWHSLPWYPSCPQLFLGSPFKGTKCCLFDPRSLIGCRQQRYWKAEIPAPLLLSLLLCSFLAQLSCPSSTGLVLNFCTKCLEKNNSLTFWLGDFCGLDSVLGDCCKAFDSLAVVVPRKIILTWESSIVCNISNRCRPEWQNWSWGITSIKMLKFVQKVVFEAPFLVSGRGGHRG